MKCNNKAAWLLLLMVFGGLNSVSRADDWMDDVFGAQPGDYIKSRSYIGGVGISSDIDQWGYFTGVNSLQTVPVTTTSGGTTQISDNELDLIPSITRQFGWGAMLGHREGP